MRQCSMIPRYETDSSTRRLHFCTIIQFISVCFSGVGHRHAAPSAPPERQTALSTDDHPRDIRAPAQAGSPAGWRVSAAMKDAPQHAPGTTRAPRARKNTKMERNSASWGRLLAQPLKKRRVAAVDGQHHHARAVVRVQGLDPRRQGVHLRAPGLGEEGDFGVFLGASLPLIDRGHWPQHVDAGRQPLGDEIVADAHRLVMRSGGHVDQTVIHGLPPVSRLP